MTGLDALLVAAGAVPGAWTRHALTRRSGAGPWATCGVNLLACAGLGALCGLGLRDGGAGLCLATGFLGSLSTFSTFAVDLLVLLREDRPWQAAALAAVSVLAGLAALGLGFVAAGAFHA